MAAEPVPARTFRTAAVIGTGMMGPGIAVTLAAGGLETTILSRSVENADRGLAKARSQVRILQENGLLSPGRTEFALGALKTGTDLDTTVARADLVVESGPEDMPFKQDLFARLDAISRPSAVLTTNTSGLSITEIASRCAHPERVLTTHFWNPPHLIPLVEIVRGEQTSPETAESVRALLVDCGKVPVVICKDRPGQLGNRLQMALWREAVNIVQEGIASAEDVDLAAKNGFGIRLPVYGIFEHADAVGLDLVHAVMDYVSRDLYSEPRAPELIQSLIRSGDLGVKSGKGFYDWSKKDSEDVASQRDRFVLEFLRSSFSRRP